VQTPPKTTERSTIAPWPRGPATLGARLRARTRLWDRAGVALEIRPTCRGSRVTLWNLSQPDSPSPAARPRTDQEERRDWARVDTPRRARGSVMRSVRVQPQRQPQVSSKA